MSQSDRIRVGVALEGAGWHPASWREASSRPTELFTARYWTDLAQIAQRGAIDFLTIEDSFALQSENFLDGDGRTDEVRGRLDALLIAARLSPVTSGIGLIPTVTTTYTEPFHVSKAIATLDYTSGGRAGWQAKISPRLDEARHIGRRTHPGDRPFSDPAVAAFAAELFRDAGDSVEAIRRLWDSWEDDAVIRDVETDRYLDADRVHEVDFEGEFFSIRGPSITPRPPQGQPVVAALAHATAAFEFAARAADIVFTTPADAHDAGRVLQEVKEAQSRVRDIEEPLQTYADLVVFLDSPEGESGADRKARLDALGRPFVSDAATFTGSAAELAELIESIHAVGFSGVRLRPGVVTDDLPGIAGDVTAALHQAGLFQDHYQHTSLRESLGLRAVVPNRFAAATA